jgi:two-component system chemotaxis response regulator CheY
MWSPEAGKLWTPSRPPGLKNRSYRLICLDIMIPEMDGQAVLKEIRSLEASEGILDGCGVKVIMTSSLRDGKNVMTAFRELCDGYLIKPFDRGNLLEQLRKFRLIL